MKKIWRWKIPFRINQEEQFIYEDYISKLTVDLDDVIAFSPFYSEAGNESKCKSIIKVRDIGDLVIKTPYPDIKTLKGLHESKIGF